MTDLSVLVLPDRHPTSAWLAEVVEAERAGVHTVWTYDHLTWPLLRDNPWYGCVPLLAAAAGATERVRLGVQVATPNYRHPVPFAKELMTLDQLSGGRLEVGLGAGTESLDALVLGEPRLTPRERMDRFAEWIGLLDKLLVEPVVTAHGERYHAVDAHQLPGCVQTPRVPFTVAGTGPRSLGLVARHGQAWVTYGPYGPAVSPEEWFAALEKQSGQLDAVLEGRRIRRIVNVGLESYWPFESRDRYADTVGRLAALGFDEVSVHWPRPDGRGVPAKALADVLAVHNL
ncbi:LLM class flavin-dependent oxidoreductase [Paractinoplanes brasiliensis]|uniref:Luciferase-like monooxygenase n=1 Tax=Paractinoplanes brasiliensis TaxID=52695 RepID=A0A4R6JML7_9ACTN|nr:LLM class flavin-dependent oxidoreductase [Actinoplanes brasiliensis]TDO36972.1 luciferase-like monooxygenase [Actinoplanes brasiliensis]GID30495.1 luciferase [Actinoplanes brasiliensis]